MLYTGNMWQVLYRQGYVTSATKEKCLTIAIQRGYLTSARQEENLTGLIQGKVLASAIQRVGVLDKTNAIHEEIFDMCYTLLDSFGAILARLAHLDPILEILLGNFGAVWRPSWAILCHLGPS